MSLSSWNRFLVFASPMEIWKCAPVPVRFENGLGMKVAIMPIWFAISRGRHLEEDVAVGGGHRVAVGEVDLELAVGVLVVDLVDVDAHLHGSASVMRVEERSAAGETLVVVAGLLQRVGVVAGHDAAVGAALEQHELGLDAGVERQALGLQLVRRVLEREARIVRIGLAASHGPRSPCARSRASRGWAGACRDRPRPCSPDRAAPCRSPRARSRRSPRRRSAPSRDARPARPWPWRSRGCPRTARGCT